MTRVIAAKKALRRISTLSQKKVAPTVRILAASLSLYTTLYEVLSSPATIAMKLKA